ncbi:Ficolin-2 [Bulinus truncatus]|nr:Ficolin-2 [Bulinus truncatus]
MQLETILLLLLVTLYCIADDVDSLVGRFASTNGVINLKCFVDDEPKQGPVHFNSCKDVVSKSSRAVVTLSSGLEVMCDTETDGGNDFYLGNENIYRITSIGTYELRVDFEYNQKKYFAKYSTFNISNEYEGYRLLVSGYLGNAGDSLASQNGMKFSTFDIDHDIFPENCAVEFQGGWWYKECHESNLNGLWGNKEFGRGLNWMTTTGYYASATMTEMKLRKTK